jgi:hypothetical protein
MDVELAKLVVALLIGVLGSAGFWSYIQHKDKSRSATNRALMGLVYDKLMFLGLRYLERGWITKDEYEDYRKYFFEPYKDLGGNGTAERIMDEISRLPIKQHSKITDVINAAKAGREEEHRD